MFSSPFDCILPCPSLVSPSYLDTTYSRARWQHPSQEDSINHVLRVIRSHLDDPGTLFLFGAYSIGKERLLLKVAQEFKVKLCVGRRKYKLLQAVCADPEQRQYFYNSFPPQSDNSDGGGGDHADDAADANAASGGYVLPSDVDDIFTCDPAATRFHVLRLGEVADTFPYLKPKLAQCIIIGASCLQCNSCPLPSFCLFLCFSKPPL